MKIDEIVSIDIKENDNSKPVMALDFSKLNSISTCPMYGITRHILNKNFQVNERSMALECGDLCHKCFAVYRALSIYFRGEEENNETLAKIGIRELSKVFREVCSDADDNQISEFIKECFEKAEEKVTKLAKFTIFSDFIIDNSGYYDDPEDKKRTIANIKDSLVHYCSNFLEIVIDEPVWIEDENDENSKVGIEIPFNTIVTITFVANGMENIQDFNFIGKIDGIHVKRKDNNSLIIHENKTASRLDDSWLGQWYKSHQITGYCLVGSYFTNQECIQARVLGMQIPAPKSSGYAFRMERVDREHFSFSDWARWILTTYEIIEDYKEIPEKAPMNTHACCKFYRQCAFIPVCCSSEEERKRIIEEDMVIDEWNPLEGD
jgi:hypothetical protein